MIIKRTIEGVINESGKIPLEWAWDSDDPMVIKMSHSDTEESTWTIGRSLILHGIINGYSGEGTILLSRRGGWLIRFQLFGDGFSCTIDVIAHKLQQMLNETYVVVPYISETNVTMDRLLPKLENLLKGIAQ